MSNKPLEIDCVAGSQLRDTQGEMLSVEGCDISALENGTAKWTDNHGKGFFNNIGRITFGKKIFKAEDCDDDRQRYYWDKIKAPYIYARGYLYNNEDHPNAKSAAAVVRNIHKSDCPLKMKASVEGGVIARGIKDPTLLARTKLAGIALTLTPANQATLVEPLSLDKSFHDYEADLILIKSVLHLAQTNVPSFRHITRAASAEKIEQNISKIMTALGKEVPADLKQELIKASLERKIADNIVTINKLVKAMPGPDEDYYNIKAGYTGKDAKKAQLRAVKDMMNYYGPFHKPFKTMVNEATGKPEMHMMVHRGVSGPTEDPKPGQKNRFKVTPTHIEQPEHAVHAMSYAAAHEYTGHEFDAPPKGEGRWVNEKWVPHKQGPKKAHPDAGIYSMWVPVNHVETTGGYMAARFKNPNAPLPENAGWYGTNEDEQRHSISQNAHSDAQGHVAIKPGRYKRVTKIEMQDMHNRWHKNFKARDPKTHVAYLNENPPLSPQFKHLFPDDPQEKLTYTKAKAMKKALTAGYGGAGSPLGMTGGGVLQSESQELGPKGLNFITCDHCGKEQVYGKFQVKCREPDCGKAFSMNKLEKYFQIRRK